jgi:hypothetical protein
VARRAGVVWFSLDDNPTTPLLRSPLPSALWRFGRGMSRYDNPSPTLTFSGFSSMPDAFAPSISSVAKSWSV